MTGGSSIEALVVRNITDIGAAMSVAVETVDPRLWVESGKTTTEWVTKKDTSWLAHSKPAEHEVWIAHRSWLIPDTDVPEADFCLMLDERLPMGGAGDTSWLAEFIAAGPNSSSVALWIEQEILSKSAWKKLLKDNQKIVDGLTALGFQFDENDNRRLCVPVVVDKEELALAFEAGSFDDAMAPLAHAADVALSAEKLLDELRELAIACA